MYGDVLKPKAPSGKAVRAQYLRRATPKEALGRGYSEWFMAVVLRNHKGIGGEIKMLDLGRWRIVEWMGGPR